MIIYQVSKRSLKEIPTILKILIELGNIVITDSLKETVVVGRIVLEGKNCSLTQSKNSNAIGSNSKAYWMIDF